jgi:hypothetical protein
MRIRFLPVAVLAAGLGLAGTAAPSLSASMAPAVNAGDANTSLIQEAQSRREYRSNRNRGERQYNRHRGDRRYNRERHGNRYRYRHGRYRHYHNGYYYANPWWLVPGIGVGIGLGAVTPGYSCGYWQDQCAARWGYRGSNYYGCMRYHGC